MWKDINCIKEFPNNIGIKKNPKTKQHTNNINQDFTASVIKPTA